LDPKQPWANFAGGPADSIFNPLVLAVILVAGILILLLPRRKAVFPFLLAGLLIPNDQVVVIASVHFPMLRFLLLFGLARVAWTKMSRNEEIFSGGLNLLDKAVILLGVFIVVDGTLLYQELAEAIYQIGQFFTGVGTYVVLRFLIRDEEDVKRAIRALAFVTVVVAGFMTYEALTGKNLIYATLGGQHASYLQEAGERDNRIRASGVFAHPILAGTFGGFMLPLFIGLWVKEKKGRIYAAGGAVGAVIMAITANASTALMGCLGGICAFCFWPLRRNMRAVRWGVIATLAGGQMYMSSPIWHIIQDVDLAGGSSSYHRYLLVDQCIRHFWSWMLIGTKDYGNWGLDSFDLSDQYVGTADTAGLIPFILLLMIIVLGFKYVGRMRRFAQTGEDTKQEFFVWAFGASLFANVVAFFGISYFDQTIVAWYALLALICTVTLPARSAKAVEAEALAVRPHLQLSPAPASGTFRSLQTIENEKHTRNGKTNLFQPEHAVIKKRLR
jgi:hypothetical protein